MEELSGRQATNERTWFLRGGRGLGGRGSRGKIKWMQHREGVGGLEGRVQNGK